MADEKIAKEGHTVKVHYEGRLAENNQVFDSSYVKDQQGNEKKPIEFKIGEGKVIKGFDQGVTGMKVGEKKEIEIPKTQAYGDRDPNRVTQIPIEELKKSGMPEVKVGMALLMQDKNNPQVQMPGVIIKVEDKTATLDFNHPLAGKDLKFTLELIDVKEN